MTKTKICNGPLCKGKEKPITEFNKGRTECRECSKHIWKERYDKRKLEGPKEITEKFCTKCNKTLPISEFHKKPGSKDGYRELCKEHENDRRQDWRYKKGENVKPSKKHAWNVLFGNYIGEQIAAMYFNDAKQMKYNHPGFDLICKNGYKIDVKCAMRINNAWRFGVKKNKVADYFILIGFGDNKDDLKPEHIWLFKNNDIVKNKPFNEQNTFYIPFNKAEKFLKFEQPLDKLNLCCENIKVHA